MTKLQKIWLGIFLAMVIMPEFLWSPTGNFLYELSQSGNTHPFRDNFLQNSDNINILSTVLFIQLAGLVLTFFYLILIHKNIKNKIVLWSCCALLLFGAIIEFYIFGFSISLRHIGF